MISLRGHRSGQIISTAYIVYWNKIQRSCSRNFFSLRDYPLWLAVLLGREEVSAF